MHTAADVQASESTDPMAGNSDGAGEMLPDTPQHGASFFRWAGTGAAGHPPRVLSSGKDDIMALTNNGKGMAGMDNPCTPDNERGAAGKENPHMLDNEATFRQLMDFIQGLTTQEELAQNREKRRPSCEQLRKQYAPIARKTTRETCCEAFENGYAVFDNGDRKTVIWIPDCPKAARYYYPATYDEKCKEKRRRMAWWEEEDEEDEYSRIIAETEPGEDRLDEEALADMNWYLAVAIAGENQIEQNLEHPLSAENRSDEYIEEYSARRYSWHCGTRFQTPEEAILEKEEREERCAGLTEKQKEVYLLYYEEGYTEEAIAVILNVSQIAVHKKLKAIRRVISEYYSEENTIF